MDDEINSEINRESLKKWLWLLVACTVGFRCRNSVSRPLVTNKRTGIRNSSTVVVSGFLQADYDVVTSLARTSLEFEM